MGSAVPSRVSLLISILRLNLVLTYGIPPEFRGGVQAFMKPHTQSGRSRVYRVTQLLTDDVHCRESAGTGPEILKVGKFTPRGTGDTVLDMFIATAVPMLVQGLAYEWSKVKPRVWALLTRVICWVHTDRYFRTISFEKMISTFREDNHISDGSHRNNILQRAVLLYVGQLGVRYPEAEVMLAAVKEKGTMEGQQQDYLGRPRVVYGSTAEQLKAYQINITPPWNHWVYVGDDIRFRAVREVKEEGRSGTAIKKTTTFMFSCEKPDGDMRIQAFVDRAFQWYCTAMKSTEDNSRYLYNLLTENRDTVGSKARAGQNNDPGMAWMVGADRERMRIMSSGSKPHRYQRYKLGDVKGFDSLFFPEKAKLLKILQNFENKTGKYAINGYPHKLGLLLHGPPGTGKTSLIKALALHTKRHIVSVPLARITTNQDLMDIMYDQNFWVVKEELPVTLPFESMIFVMEDIDAQSPIVRCRSHPLGKRRTRRQFDQQQQQQPQKLVITKAQGVTPASSTTNSTSDGTRSPFLFSQRQKNHLVPAQKSDNHDSTTVTVTAGAEGTRVDSSPDSLVDRFPCLSDPMISISSEISDSSLSSSMTKLTEKPATTVPSIECTEASKAVVSDETPLVASEASTAVISGCRDETAPAQRTEGIESQPEGRLDGESGGSGAAEVRGLLGATEDQEQILTVKSRDDTRARGREAAVHVAAASLRSVKLDGGDDEYLESSNSDMFEEEEVARMAQGEGIGVGERMMASALVELAGKGSDQRANMKEYARWTDKLDLAGLLNALDGVVDSPGRIVIITTNHPEMLDPALIRPGRIDKNIYLDYMRYPAAVEMTRHFFQVEDLTASEHERLRAVFEGGAVSSSFDEGIKSSPRRITPATVEQLAGEHDNVGDFIEALEALC